MNRRTFLRGAAGASLALPALDIMFNAHGEAHAGGAAIPKRYGAFFVPAVIGANRSGAVGNPNANADIADTYIPDTVGYGYDLKAALAPLAAHDGIQDEIAVITGLRVPSDDMLGDYHDNYFGPMMCGIPVHPDDVPSGWNYKIRGPSSDMIVKDHIGGDTLFEFLAYGVQASNYGGAGPGMSFRGGGNGELAERVIPENSPRAAYDSLFFNFVDQTDPIAVAQYEYEVASRTSVLDLVGESLTGLETRLGATDRLTMEKHLQEVRELEMRIAALPPPNENGCELPGDPGADPPIGANGSGTDSNAVEYGDGDGYSDEDSRARVFADLVHMAFACDLTRVVSFQFGHIGSYMNCAAITESGFVSGWHQLGHGEEFGAEAMAELLAWNYKHFAYLVAKLRDTPVGAGRLLDHCALALTHEGGAQNETYTGDSPHSFNRAACLLAGRAGGLQTGQHVATDGAHVARVFLTAMRGVGVDVPLGNHDEPLAELMPG
ncbi:MAG: DUF1552 domain-containing protein [Myxococcota bacterium]